MNISQSDQKIQMNETELAKSIVCLPSPCRIFSYILLWYYSANLLLILQFSVSPNVNSSIISSSCFGLIYFLGDSLNGSDGTSGKQTHCDKTPSNNPNQRGQKAQKAPIAIKLVNVNR